MAKIRSKQIKHDEAEVLFDGTTATTQTRGDNSTKLSTTQYIDSVYGDLFSNGIQGPNGFPNRTDSTITYNPATRIISIAPAVSTFDYYLNGVKYTISGAQTPAAHANATGLYYFYWDSTNTLQFTTAVYNILTDVLISYVYYDAGKTDGYFSEERHSSYRNPVSHIEFHEEIGTYIPGSAGFAISGYAVQPGAPADTDNTFALALGTIADEDIRFDLGALPDDGPYVLFYRTGASGDWTFDKAQSLPYYSGGSYIQYNQDTGSTWQLTELVPNRYVNYYVFKTLDLSGVFETIIIPSQQFFTSLVSAQAEGVEELQYGALPFVEIAPLYQITFRTSAAYGSTGKCRIEATPVRLVGTKASITQAGQTVHNALSGLQLAAASATWGHIDDQVQTIAGVKTFADGIKTDSILEETGGEGVDIDGVLVKDEGITVGFFPAQLKFGESVGAPYAWFHLNSSAGSTAYDSSGFGRDLTTVNMVDGDWVAGKLNNCLQFAATKYAVAASSLVFNFDNTDAFSIEGWIDVSGGSSEALCSKMINDAARRGFQWVKNPTTGELVFSLRNDQTTNVITVEGSTNISVGSFVHVVVTYDGSSTAAGVKQYVNSVLETPNILSDTLTATTITTGIFQISGRFGTNLNWTGKVDEFVVYDRVIDQSFINSRYNGGAGTEVIPGFANTGALNVNSSTGKMTQTYGGDCEIVTSASSSKILFTPPSNGAVEITDGEYFQWPGGITGDRPGSPANGMVRYNTTTSRNEFYENGSWENYLTESLENLWDRVTGPPNYVLPHTAADDIGATGARITKGWFTDLESTNMLTVGGTSINANSVLDLTSGEVTQLANINAVTISNAQWGYLGALNQALATTDGPTFDGGTFTDVVTYSGNDTGLYKQLFYNASAPSDEKYWGIKSNNDGTLDIFVANDALSVIGIVTKIARTGINIDYQSFEGDDSYVQGDFHVGGAGSDTTQEWKNSSNNTVVKVEASAAPSTTNFVIDGSITNKANLLTASYNPSALTITHHHVYTSTAGAYTDTISTEDIQSASTTLRRPIIVSDASGAASTNNITIAAESGTVYGYDKITSDYGMTIVDLDGTDIICHPIPQYEEYTHTSNFGGIWASSYSRDCKIIKIGKTVSMFVPAVIQTATSADTISMNTVLPARFRPPSGGDSSSCNFPVNIVDNGVYENSVAILGSDGSLQVYGSEAGGNYAGAGNSGYPNINLQWNVA